MTDPLYAACREYLRSKQAILWSDFDLTRPERFDAAVDWLYEQTRGVHSYV